MRREVHTAGCLQEQRQQPRTGRVTKSPEGRRLRWGSKFISPRRADVDGRWDNGPSAVTGASDCFTPGGQGDRGGSTSDGAVGFAVGFGVGVDDGINSSSGTKVVIGTSSSTDAVASAVATAVKLRQASAAGHGREAEDDRGGESTTVVLNNASHRTSTRLCEALPSGPISRREDATDAGLVPEAGGTASDSGGGRDSEVPSPTEDRIPPAGRLASNEGDECRDQEKRRVNMIHGVAIYRENGHATPQTNTTGVTSSSASPPGLPISRHQGGGCGGGEGNLMNGSTYKLYSNEGAHGGHSRKSKTLMMVRGAGGESKRSTSRWVPPKKPKGTRGRSAWGPSPREVLHRVLAAGQRQPFDSRVWFAKL